MDVFVANEQSEIELDEQRFVSLARVAADEEGVDPSAELSVLFVDRESMAQIRERHMGEAGPTDVLSFLMDEEPEDDDLPYMLGDIVICPDVARENAAGDGSTVTEELDLLFVHGFLHLLHYDHVKPQDARAMRHRERKILQAFYRVGTPAPPAP
jgi:probable rRNA maturation factor